MSAADYENVTQIASLSSDREGDGGTTSSAVTDARIAAALDYWRAKAAGRPMPCRSDIDPIEIPKLLRDIMLVDVLPDGRYRYRLIGTGNTTAHGFSATGRYLDEVLPGREYRDHVLGLYDECVRERRPLYSECLFLSPRQQPARHTKVIFLPLSDDGDIINMVFVVQVFLYLDELTRERHFLDAPAYREITRIRL